MQEIISNYSGYKIAGTIGVTRSSAGTFYTVPANSFALLNLFIQTGSGSITIDGRIVFSGQSGANGNSSVAPGFISGTMPGCSLEGVYAGPGSVIACSSGMSSVHITGVLFTNSP
jgi:hypothetical protein